MDRFDINVEIARLVGGSSEPLEELKSIIGTCSVLWDQYVVLEEVRVGLMFLKFKQEVE